MKKDIPLMKPTTIPSFPFRVNGNMAVVDVNCTSMYLPSNDKLFQPPDISQYQKGSISTGRNATEQYLICQPPSDAPYIWEIELPPPDTIFDTLKSDEDVYYHIYRKYDQTCPCPLVFPPAVLSIPRETSAKRKNGKRSGRTKQCFSAETDKYQSLRLEISSSKAFQTTTATQPLPLLPTLSTVDLNHDGSSLASRGLLLSLAPPDSTAATTHSEQKSSMHSIHNSQLYDIAQLASNASRASIESLSSKAQAATTVQQWHDDLEQALTAHAQSKNDASHHQSLSVKRAQDEFKMLHESQCLAGTGGMDNLFQSGNPSRIKSTVSVSRKIKNTSNKTSHNEYSSHCKKRPLQVEAVDPSSSYCQFTSQLASPKHEHEGRAVKQIRVDSRVDSMMDREALDAAAMMLSLKQFKA
jgi:hypothetical protein